MLKVNAEEQNRDYLDYLLPFIHEAITTKKVEQINEITVSGMLPPITVSTSLDRRWAFA